MSKRFVVNNQDLNIEDNIITIRGSEVNHLNVLRHKINDLVEINEYFVKILDISKDKLVGQILKKVIKRGEPKVQITLYQGYLKSDKMDIVVQKSVELGIKYIVPVMTKNTVVKLDDTGKIKKTERLNKVAIEAIGQCGRTDNVEVKSVENLKDLLGSLKQNNVNILAYEESKNSLKKCINIVKEKFEKGNKTIPSIGIIIGPEGGFDKEEIDYLNNNLDNIYEISLGERILRSETASAYILSIITYEFE